MKKTKDKATKSFAQTYWQEFEDLSVHIVKHKYDVKHDLKHKITGRQHDGGYDGILWFRLDNANEADIQKLLVEAKLRSNSQCDLPLSDFAKTILIAINTIADKVYISSNTHFSVETISRLQDFSQRTGLEIRTIDLKDTTLWIRNHRDQINNQQYSSEFIDLLLNMERDIDEKHRVLSIDSETIEELFLPKAEALIGEQRVKDRDAMVKQLKTKSGIFFIDAPSGMGKSVFIRNVFRELGKSRWQLRDVDCTVLQGTREIFLTFLSIFWNLSRSEIMALDDNALTEIMQYLGDEIFPEKQKELLLNMLRTPQSDFEMNIDLNNFYLLEYLQTICRPLFKRKNYCISIKAAHRLTKPSLEFLEKTIHSFSGANISFIVERQNPLVKNSPGGKDTWDRFIADTKTKDNYYGTILLKQWTLSECSEYILSVIPDFPPSRIPELIKRFSPIPVFLSTSLMLYQKSPHFVISNFVKDYALPSTASDAFTLGAVDTLIETIAYSEESGVQLVLVLLGVFDGNTRISDLASYMDADSIQITLKAINASGIAIADDEQITVLHEIYLNSIQKYAFLPDSVLRQMAKQIQDRLPEVQLDSGYKLRKEYHLARISKNRKRLIEIWEGLSDQQLALGEYGLAIETMEVIHEMLFQNIGGSNLLPADKQYKVISKLLQAHFAMGVYNSPEIKVYIEELPALLVLNETSWPGGKQNYDYCSAEVLHRKCSVALALGKYQDLKTEAERGLQLTEMYKETQFDALQADFWFHKAMALKHTKNLQACLQCLELGVKTLNNPPKLLKHYYSHQASLYTGSEPSKALEFFQKIERWDINEPIGDIIHNQHNIATMYFLMGDRQKAKELGAKVWADANKFFIKKEIGRVSNLLGCIAWAEDNVDEAIYFLNESYLFFKRNIHHTHIWPPLVNLTLLYREQDNPIECYKYANSAVENLLGFHLENINNLGDFAIGNLPKLYVALLLLLDIYSNYLDDQPMVEKILTKITSQRFYNDYERYVRGGKLKDLLEHTAYCQIGHYMLKV